MIENTPAFISFLLGLLTTSVFIFFLMPKQFKEVIRPYDGLTRLRWYILAILVFSIITAIPGLTYVYFRSTGHEYHVLRNIASILGRISSLATTILLILVYTYRTKR
jgi:hypothetical protein